MEQVKTCQLATPLFEVVNLLQESSIGSVVVVDEKHKVIGIFTERDFITKLGGKEAVLLNETVEKFLTPDPVCLKNTDSLALAMLKMRMGSFRHIVIVDKNETLENVISQQDILNYLIDMTGRG